MELISKAPHQKLLRLSHLSTDFHPQGEGFPKGTNALPTSNWLQEGELPGSVESSQAEGRETEA